MDSINQAIQMALKSDSRQFLTLLESQYDNHFEYYKKCPRNVAKIVWQTAQDAKSAYSLAFAASQTGLPVDLHFASLSVRIQLFTQAAKVLNLSSEQKHAICAKEDSKL